MKSILMSIQSKWLCEILNGRKTVELRKRFPKDYRGWVYLYCTKAIKGMPTLIRNAFSHFYTLDTCYFDSFQINLSGKVVGRVWIDNVEEIVMNEIENCDIVFNNYDRKGTDDLLGKMSISFDEFSDYHLENRRKGKNRKVATSFAIHFSKLEIFNKPKELGEFSVERYAEMPNGVFPCYEPIIKAPQSWQYIYIEEDK